MNKTIWFRIVAGWAAVYHMCLAVLGTFVPQSVAEKVIVAVYGANIVITPQIAYLIKFISAYFFAFAFAMALLAWKPLQYRNLVWVAITLFVVRIFDRIFFLDLLRSAFGGEIGRDMITVGMLLTMGMLLIVLRPKSGTE
jgi:hypothetical protein